jgi:hypothetical protein
LGLFSFSFFFETGCLNTGDSKMRAAAAAAVWGRNLDEVQVKKLYRAGQGS